MTPRTPISPRPRSSPARPSILRERDRHAADHYNCAHGVGHGFMGVLRQRRLRVSARLRRPRRRLGAPQCYGGVFMENLSAIGHPTAAAHGAAAARPAVPVHRRPPPLSGGMLRQADNVRPLRDRQRLRPGVRAVRAQRARSSVAPATAVWAATSPSTRPSTCSRREPRRARAPRLCLLGPTRRAARMRGRRRARDPARSRRGCRPDDHLLPDAREQGSAAGLRPGARGGIPRTAAA